MIQCVGLCATVLTSARILIDQMIMIVLGVVTHM